MGIGGKDRIAEYRSFAALELAKPAEVKYQVDLARAWDEVAKSVRTDSHIIAVRRARLLLCEALASQDLKGLDRAEAEKMCLSATAEIEKQDARVGRFTLYEGKWVVKYENKYTHESIVAADGILMFDRRISPDGTPSLIKEGRKTRLVRRGRAVPVPFEDGNVVERCSRDADKLIVERFDPSSDYPTTLNTKGEGARER